MHLGQNRLTWETGNYNYTRKHGDNINQTKASLRHTATANAIVINKHRGLKRKSEEKYSFKLVKKVSCYKWMFLSD